MWLKIIKLLNKLDKFPDETVVSILINFLKKKKDNRIN